MKKLLNTLYVTIPETYLSLDGENVVILKEHQELGRVPLHNLERIMTFGYMGVSPALMGKCVADKIELVFMNPYGKFLARLEGSISGNVLLRREQFRIAEDPEKTLEIAKNMITGKLYNSRQLVLRVLRDHEMRVDQELFRKKAEFMKVAMLKCKDVEDMNRLRGFEGESASVYFSIFNDMILQQKKDFIFSTRSKRPPLDKVNALLSFCYSLCTSMCTSALESVGLDPYVGFMHTDRPGRRSLALDLLEEFRAWHCDRFVLMLINKKVVSADDFQEREDGAVYLNEKGRKTVLAMWQKKKMEVVKHPFLGEKVEWGMLPYIQALLLARYIRGDLDTYPVFLWK